MRISRSFLAVTVMLATQSAHAAGFQLNAQSATGLGRAFAGDAVIADNASVIARNPAAMALFKEASYSVGFETITTLIEVKDATYTGLTGSIDADESNAGSTSVAPNFYMVMPIDDKIAWGVSIYSNYGTKTEFDDSYSGYEYGGSTDVKSINLGLSGSYRIDPQWSIGAGLDFIYGQGVIKRNFSPAISSILGSSTALDADADGWVAGLNLGIVYEKNQDNRFGLDYHYVPDLQAKGDISYAGYTGSSNAISDTLVMPLPDIAEFSGYHRLNNDFAVHYSIQWINWSEFDALVAQTSGTLNDYQWKDGWHYSVGGTYYLNRNWTLRAGYMYDVSAQDSITSISVPDSNRQWFSTGFTYQIDKKSNMDLGFTYLLGKDVAVNESTDNPYYGLTGQPQYLSTMSATTHADAIMFGLQYSREF